MTDAERIEAARIMQGPGPWDWQNRVDMPVGEWWPNDAPPLWNWECCRYRIRPPPAPPALPCPCCGADGTPCSVVAPMGWYRCGSCSCHWDQSRRAPCPKCAEAAKMLGEIAPKWTTGAFDRILAVLEGRARE